eukprot:198665_1
MNNNLENKANTLNKIKNVFANTFHRKHTSNTTATNRLRLDPNWFQKWPYNDSTHDNQSFNGIQSYYILSNWCRNTHITEDIINIIQIFFGKNERFLNEFEILKVIGKGTFSTVFQSKSVISHMNTKTFAL